MTEQHLICQNCILPDGFLGIRINSKGFCNFCENPKYKTINWSKVQIDNKLRERCLKDWNITVKYMQKNYGKQKYDCVIGYSGGKDSTALVDTFITEYKLNPLLITVDTGFMTDVAKENIKDTLNKMNLYQNHILIEEAIPTFTKLYKHFFLNHFSNEKSLTVDICHICTDLIHTIIVKEAIKREIKYVIIGFSPDQIARYFYETLVEDIIKDGTPDSMFKENFDENDERWYLTQKEKLSGKLPRVLYPYHVIDYDEKEIIKRIESKGLIKVGKSDPTLTNCHVVKAALMYDLYRYGGLTYALQYAELIRQEPNLDKRRKSRKDWLRLYKSVARSILNGTFNVDGMNLFFNKIGVSQEELLKTIEKHRNSDPNK
ncbi:MAG: hypothetical protein ACTSQJ_11685, partial [Promethearchaeota archaeon]